MEKKTKLLIVLFTFVFAFVLVNPNVFAQGKNGLAHLVQEHTEKIAQLEDAIQNISGSNSENEVLEGEVKEALLKEVTTRIDRSSNTIDYETGEELNITDFKLDEVNGEVVLQFFLEGDYDWTFDSNGNYTLARSFAQNFIFNFDPIPKMYGVDMNYEFYQNGEQVTIFID
ncbi:hypothetical protein CR203_03750 [Salipaludibacillus neizhouensis]|uniref:Uncharacterized protein n=1 Tax=Salipaludibacillus neizhouensis TaxID=885475 RepID=A0A3A9KXJ3_9BACI|nr:hypothetical protein [Salipaludibacillus neizhouensis]RKL69156.1 hypothetical protein CR203_03750 [Salipaludibacillus neizhouensis]